MKIKVKRVRGGSMGDQRNYGLVTGSIWNYEDKPSTNTVSGTMSPTDRENATIEAERGETVVGDLNNDGMLEHLKIGGKRHAQGGTPLNVPDGSFVFSDYRGLLIKNKELLSNVFGYKGGKSATPAKVARRYELNKYNDILNDPHADFLDQKTAQLMLDNNLKKLGQLALVQESMKGFPDGIPNIALPLFGSDVPAQKPQMMKKGGLVKAQAGVQYWEQKSKGKLPPIIPINNDTISQENAPQWNDPTMLGDIATIAGSPFASLMATGYRGGDWRDYVQQHRGNPIDAAINAVMLGYAINPSKMTQLAPLLNRAPRAGGFAYDMVVNPYGGAYEYGGSLPKHQADKSQVGVQRVESDDVPLWKQALLLAGTGAALVPTGMGLKWLWEHDVNKEVTRRKRLPSGKYKQVTKIEKVPAGIGPMVKPYIKAGAKTVGKAIKSIPGAGWLGAGLTALGAVAPFIYDWASEDEPTEVPAPQATRNAYIMSPDSAKSIMDMSRSSMQDLFTNTPSKTNAAVPNTTEYQGQEEEEEVYSTQPAVNYQPNFRTATIDSSILQDTVPKTQRLGGGLMRFESQGQVPIYSPQSAIGDTDQYEVIRSAQKFPYKVDVQSFDPATGTYTIVDPSTNKKVELDLNDLFSRIQTTEQETGESLVKDYKGGFDQWKKDVVNSDQAKREAAVGHFQTNYENLRKKLNLPSYFYGQPGSTYALDKKLGLYTFSAPGLRKKVVTPPAVAAEPAAPTPPIPDNAARFTEGPKFQGAKPQRDVGLWPGDIAALNATAEQIIPRYLLTSSRMTAPTMETVYTTANVAPMIGAYNAYLQSMGTGPEARGTGLSARGAAGKSLEAINREIEANRAANLDVYYKTGAANMEALNRAALYNAEEQKDYINRYNTILESTAKDINKKRAMFAKGIDKALANRLKLTNINAMLPYQYSDWYGTQVVPGMESIYDSPITGGISGGTSSYDSLYRSELDRIMAANPSADPVKAAQAAAAYATGATRSSGGYGTRGAATSIFDFLDTE